MTVRSGSAPAVIAILVALIVGALSSAVPAAVAQDPPPRLSGHLPVNGGVGLLLWDGGLTLALIDEAERAGCSVASLYVNRPGGEDGLLSYIPRIPRGESPVPPGLPVRSSGFDAGAAIVPTAHQGRGARR